jgi:hypothetical protein
MDACGSGLDRAEDMQSDVIGLARVTRREMNTQHTTHKLCHAVAACVLSKRGGHQECWNFRLFVVEYS